LEEAASPTLVHHVARIERLLPDPVTRRMRAGVWRQGAAAPPDRVARLLAEACADPTSRARQAWTLVSELATAGDVAVDALVAHVDAVTDPLEPAERAKLGPMRDLAMTLHAWGRGRLDGTPGAATLAERLADAVVQR